MLGKDIQGSIYQALAALFDPGLVKLEWSVRKGAADVFKDKASYAPRLDMAVGPFNLTIQNREKDANAIWNFRHSLIESLEAEVSKQNNGGVYANRNPRCLLAIEVEHSTSSKHILGAITNASMACFEQVEFLNFLRNHEGIVPCQGTGSAAPVA